MLSLPIHGTEISVFFSNACCSSSGSPQLCFHWLSTTPVPSLGYYIRTARRMPWPCDKPYVSTCSSPLALTPPPMIWGHIPRDSLQLWMKNNGLVFSEIYLGWWRTANPPSQVYQTNSQKSGSDIALLLLQTSSFFTPRGCIISLPSAGYTSLSPF